MYGFQVELCWVQQVRAASSNSTSERNEEASETRVTNVLRLLKVGRNVLGSHEIMKQGTIGRYERGERGIADLVTRASI